MPVEASRVTRTIKIPVPGSDTLFWPVRVIDQISFLDKARGWQEHIYSYNNNAAAARVTRVVNVGPEGSSIAVERIDALSMRDEREGWQEYIWEFSAPHVRTHDKVIQAVDADGNKNEDVTLTVRRIDAFSFLDKVEGWQETVFDLAWDDAGEYDYLDAGNAVAVSEPYRLDPYQMIVSIQDFAPDWVIVVVDWNTGKDLDIRAKFETPSGPILGWNRESSAEDYAVWVSGDVTGVVGPELIVIDMAKIREQELTEILISMRLYWYEIQGNSASIQVEMYKGGTYDLIAGTAREPDDYNQKRVFDLWVGNVSFSQLSDVDGDFVGTLQISATTINAQII